jgi:hypothetical protein
MAEMLELNPYQQTFLILLCWMVRKYNDEVFVLDIDFEQGGSTLYGDTDLLTKFRTELNEIMTRVATQSEPWREW